MRYLCAVFVLFLTLPSPAASLSFETCRVPEVDRDLKCAVLKVPEDPASGAGRKIPLKIRVLPATADQKFTDPIFVFAGGPGQAASDLVDYVIGNFGPLNEQRDIVFVDFRGTGESNPLMCKLYGPDVPSHFGDMLPVDRLKECRKILEKSADLTLYTTSNIVSDIEQVRKALGYPQINTYGTSYGTRVAMLYLRMYPQSIRTAILDGPAPTNGKNPLYHASAGQKSLETILAQCAADASCKNAFPDIQEEIRHVVSRLEKAPATAEITDQKTSEKIKVQITRGVFGEALRNMLYNPRMAARVPAAIHRAYLGDFNEFAEMNLGRRMGHQQGMAFGMFNSVVCTEDVPFITAAEIERETKGTFLGDYRIAQQKAACKVWARGKLPAGFRDNVRSTVPTLILSGELDPVTPPWMGKQVAEHLSNGLHIISKGGSHGGGSSCLVSIVDKFISTASVKDIDTRCASKPAEEIQFEIPGDAREK